MSERPTPGALEERTQPLELDGRKIRGLIPYGIKSRDMGGWRELIEPTFTARYFRLIRPLRLSI